MWFMVMQRENKLDFYVYASLTAINLAVYSLRVNTSNHSTTVKLTNYTPTGLWNL